MNTDNGNDKIAVEAAASVLSQAYGERAAFVPLVAQLVERWTVAVQTGIHRSLVQIRPGGLFL